MPAGFEIYKSGQLILSVTDRLCRVLGLFNLPTTSGSIIVPEFSQGDGWFATLDNTWSTGLRDGQVAVVSISGNTLSWIYQFNSVDSQPYSIPIIYGVY